MFPATYPRTQRGWTELSIELFDELLRMPGVRLAGDETSGAHTAANSGYVVLECFPTSIWRSSGLTPLPGKRKMDLGPYIASIRRAYALPPFVTSSHDDLQAVVACLAAVAVVGGPAVPLRRGVIARMAAASTSARDDSRARRVEGFIWDAAPRGVRAGVARP